MEFRSRIYASSKGTTIDAIGQGQYLVQAFGLHESAGAAQRPCGPEAAGSEPQ